MKIKVKFNNVTGEILGYYPEWIIYNNIDIINKTIEGFPYIEIDESEQILNKNMEVVDNIYREKILSEEMKLINSKTKKLQELDLYHFNSQEIRQCKINNYFILQLSSEGRSLIQEQINLLVQKIKLGLVSEQDASFEFFYNGGSIDISLEQLRRIYVAMLDIVNSNFQNYKTEINNIKNLSTIQQVENYDFTLNYLKNQNINL